mmetsp:Transcript_3686/g.5559  ORF Transcript_3686/g.5559 Transcript_3686/m.5559 type:complete len:94 (-) Transcript_3686:173-454(-)|eukprot:CAMPEP_0170513036 /NCGR_PEP_ID=MMETSP0208-20121228/67178_1 /TAXON_ID=197538 /ORGANISM="Strombidium inclinatum, Strain S3" /LENGTH=93 /DNA_ID=CAMNT_0010796725 /DNA_START=1780 /DNA_END=2061 /DNA_ORIENTATION=-
MVAEGIQEGVAHQNITNERAMRDKIRDFRKRIADPTSKIQNLLKSTSKKQVDQIEESSRSLMAGKIIIEPPKAGKFLSVQQDKSPGLKRSDGD